VLSDVYRFAARRMAVTAKVPATLLEDETS
jgi:hypothetical protein